MNTEKNTEMSAENTEKTEDFEKSQNLKKIP